MDDKMDLVLDMCLRSLRKKGSQASLYFEHLRELAASGKLIRGEKLTIETAELAIALFVSEEQSSEIAKSATNG